MDWLVVDGISMIPGFFWTNYLAWQSDDFMYRIAVLAWGWCCMCSMCYHFSGDDPKLLKYDLRSQWVSQAVITLETPQSSWPIVVGALLPVGENTRMVLNGIGAFYFSAHKPLAQLFFAMAFASYYLQFPTKKKWLHSVFHMLLHAAGIVVAVDPVKKYTSPVAAFWAWPVWLLGAWALAPPRGATSLILLKGVWRGGQKLD
jgi:hypothetical protein